MSYKPKRQGNYGNRPSRRPSNASQRIRKKTSWRADLHEGLVKTEDVKITPPPVEYVSENAKSGGVKIANAEVNGTTINKTKIEFPKKRQGKIKGIDVV